MNLKQLSDSTDGSIINICLYVYVRTMYPTPVMGQLIDACFYPMGADIL